MTPQPPPDLSGGGALAPLAGNARPRPAGSPPGVRISVVVTALSNQQTVVAHAVHQPVLEIDAPRPPAGERAAQRLRFARTGKRRTAAFLPDPVASASIARARLERDRR